MLNPFLDLILMVAGAPSVHVKSFLESDPDGGGGTFGLKVFYEEIGLSLQPPARLRSPCS